MKIALFGARGTLGSRIAAEAQRRGHTVTAAGASPSRTDVRAQEERKRVRTKSGQVARSE